MVLATIFSLKYNSNSKSTNIILQILPICTINILIIKQFVKLVKYFFIITIMKLRLRDYNIPMKWKKNLIISSITASSLVAGISYTQNIVLPNLGDASTAQTSSQQTQKLGKEVLGQIKQSVPIVNDPLWQYYIEQIGKNLLSHSRAVNTKIEFILFDTQVINAFALPGHIIGINSGLVLQSQYEGELASVIAHEIAHVTQKHYERIVEKYKKTLLTQLAGMVAAAALATVDGQAANAAITSTLAAGKQSMIGYTREHEYEADWVGIETLTNSEYSQTDMANFFNRLPKNTYHATLEALYTHPYPTKRASEALNRLNKNTDTSIKHSIIISQNEFELMQKRLKIITTQNKEKLLRNIINQLEIDPNNASLKYAKNYLQIVLNKDVKLNINALKKLSEINTDSITIIYTLIESLIDNNYHFEAQNQLNKAFSIHLDILPLLILQVKLYKNNKDYLKAKNKLLDINSEYPQYILGYKELAENEKILGNEGVSHFYMAKYYHQAGFLELALSQLKIADTYLSNDIYYHSQIRQLISLWSK